ncbi:MAG: twin-arginine translocation signal domain-containing protein [Acidobacteriaceae bacterium]
MTVLGEPTGAKDVAYAALFLDSDESPYVTRAIIVEGRLIFRASTVQRFFRKEQIVMTSAAHSDSVGVSINRRQFLTGVGALAMAAGPLRSFASHPAATEQVQNGTCWSKPPSKFSVWKGCSLAPSLWFMAPRWLGAPTRRS